MSNTFSAGHPARPQWPRPAQWPVWVVPLLLGIFSVGGSFGAQSNFKESAVHDPYPFIDLDWIAVLLLAAGPIALLLRRRFPVPVLAAAGIFMFFYLLRAYPYGPAPLASAVALIGVVMAGHRKTAWLGVAGWFTGFYVVATLIGVDPGLPTADRADHFFAVEKPGLLGLSMAMGWTFAIVTGTEFVRSRRERAAEAAHAREEEERRQAGEERLRIARELHDVLAHNISMINVQAGVALHLMDQNPEQARTALAAIKDASKEALTEMRSVIGVLRQQGESAPRSPTAGLARLPEMLARARTAGLTVRSRTAGEPRPLPAGADLAAFRIVQESLTNVTRHAGGGPVTAEVSIAYGEHEVIVQVDDDGQGVSLLTDHPSGSGLNGMRERAAALGGEFTAGPRPGGGFRVRAVLPLDEDAVANEHVATRGAK